MGTGTGEKTEGLLTSFRVICHVQWPTTTSAHPLQINYLWLFFPFPGTSHILLCRSLDQAFFCSFCWQTLLCSSYWKEGGCMCDGEGCALVSAGCESQASIRGLDWAAWRTDILQHHHLCTSPNGVELKKGQPGADGNLGSVRSRDRWQRVTSWKTSYCMRLTGNGWEL